MQLTRHVEHHHEVFREADDMTPELMRFQALNLSIQATERVFDLRPDKDMPDRGDHITEEIVKRAARFESYISGKG
jgi:hypothetical protein